MTALPFRTAQQLAAAVRSRKIGCLELLDLYLKRVERHNPRLNAIIALDIAGARKRAKAADKALAKGDVWGPLHGVPMTIKESYDVAGMPTTWGDPAFKDTIAAYHAAIEKLGRAMLPWLDEADVRIAIERQGPPLEAGTPPMTYELLQTENERVRKQGCFVATSASALGTNGTAAPVFNARGQIFGSLGVAIPAVRYDAEMQPSLSAAVIYDPSAGYVLAMVHNRATAGDPGFASDFDFDSTEPGVQFLPVSAANQILVDAGGGDNVIVIGGSPVLSPIAASQLLGTFDIRGEVIPNLYCAGSSGHPGGAISGGAGYITAGIIAKELGVPLWWTPWNAREALDAHIKNHKGAA